MRLLAALTLVSGLSFWTGCSPQRPGQSAGAAPARPAPPLPQPQQLEPGVFFHEVTVPHREGNTRIWIYLPERRKTAKIPLVLIAPAGSRGFHGMALASGDRPEHLPYVREGWAVVAYDLWGDVSDDASDAQVLAAARAWQMSEAGTICARAALDYTLARVPNIDRSRIWTAGHSSAATTSLLVASREKRVKACVAFAPATDIAGRLAPGLGDLDAAYPGFRRFIEQTSPDRNTATLTCPVFLFHAEDDGNVPVSESADFAAKLSVTNARVRFVRVPSGGHYDSMIQEGVPLAIRWLKAL